jgi:dienelactone hydrolase
VLDAIRAAQRLPGSGLPANGPVGISGYSQGGGASAAAAELQPRYAPELNVKGAYAGAVPADLGVVARNLDGHYAAGFLGYALASMDYAYPELHVTNLLNARGKQLYEQVKTECTPQAILAHAFTQTKDLTVDGRPLSAYLDEEPYKSRIEEQRIGVRRPAVPMLVAHSALDDIVPYEQDRTMAHAWCGKGATVQFSTLAVPTHAAAMVEAYPQAVAWLGDRFAGKPAPDNCGAF